MPALQNDASSLSLREEKFALLYAQLGNASEAARRSGYSGSRAKKTGYELLQRPRVRALVDRHLAEIQEAATAVHAQADAARQQALSAVADTVVKQAITEQMVIDTHLEIVRLAMEAKEYSVARAANRDLGETLGMFKQRHELTGADGGPIQTEDVTEQTRERLAGRLARLAERN